MKKLFLILFIFGGIVFAQQYEDVIYLKNGSIIRGVIIEQAPNRYIKIKSGQNVIVYQMYEIEKMVKEIISSDISLKKEGVIISIREFVEKIGLREQMYQTARKKIISLSKIN